MNKNNLPFNFDPLWAESLTLYMKSKKAMAGMTYADISEKLESTLGIIQSPENIKTKFLNGNFGAQFFIQTMYVMEVDKVKVKKIIEKHKEIKKSASQ